MKIHRSAIGLMAAAFLAGVKFEAMAYFLFSSGPKGNAIDAVMFCGYVALSVFFFSRMRAEARSLGPGTLPRE